MIDNNLNIIYHKLRRISNNKNNCFMKIEIRSRSRQYCLILFEIYIVEKAKKQEKSKWMQTKKQDTG